MEKDLKQLMAEVSADRLEYARNCEPGDANGDKAFEQGVTAFKAFTELTKVDDAHNEECSRQELEKEKNENEHKFKMSESTKEKLMKGIELGAVVIVSPIIYHFSNKGLAKFLCQAEQFETFTSTAGRSLGKMFKFK